MGVLIKFGLICNPFGISQIRPYNLFHEHTEAIHFTSEQMITNGIYMILLQVIVMNAMSLSITNPVACIIKMRTSFPLFCPFLLFLYYMVGGAD